jgi:hypothetical protein
MGAGSACLRRLLCDSWISVRLLERRGYGGGWFHAWALAADGVTALVLTYVISMVWRRLTTR